MTGKVESKDMHASRSELIQHQHTLTGGEVAIAAAAPHAPVPENELTRLLARRGTVRTFKPDPVPEQWIDAIVEHGMRSPSSSNMQAHSVVAVRDPESKKQLARLAGNQQHIIDCPLFYAICADLTRVKHAINMHDKEYPGRSFESCLVASIDACLLGMTMSLVADSFGLDNVMIGGMRNNAAEVARVLKLPPRCYVVFGLCIGWGTKRPLPKPRHPLYGVLHHEQYDPALRAKAIESYDKDLARYYRARGVDTPEAAWSLILSEKYSSDKRVRLKQELVSMGFPLE